jgi:hypothetical protein
MCGGDRVEGTNIRRFFQCFAGPGRIARTLNEVEAIDAIQSAVYADLALADSGYTFMHAGVCGWKGHALLIPGASRSGKSQLVAAMLRAGATYYSDDIAAIDADGRVHPVARDIGIRDASDISRSVPAKRFGAPIGTAPLPIALVVCTKYAPDAVWQPRQGSGGQAVLALLEHTPRARIAPAETLRTLACAVKDARMFHGPRGDADLIARELLHALEATHETTGAH